MTRKDPPSNSDDVIDSRDVIARIDELESATEDAPLDADELEELATLQSLAKEGSDYSADWQYGETLIRESCFEAYAKQLAEDIGSVKGDEAWPLNFIDWEAAAEALKEDYTEIDFGGTTYLIRNS